MEICGTISQVYPISVDYGMSIDEAIKLGKFDRVHPSITSQNFLTKREGKVEVIVELVRFNRHISTEEALSELSKMGLRPAEIHELIIFSSMHYDVQSDVRQRLLVVALGSVWQYQDGYRYCSVPFLCEDGSERILYLDWVTDDWSGRWQFAAVRK